MIKEGDYYWTLKNSYIRAYCAYERLSYDESKDNEILKLKAREQYIKIMRQIYVSVALCPEFL